MGWIVKCLVILAFGIGGSSALAARSAVPVSKSSLPIQEIEETPKKLEGDWKFSIGGRGFSEAKDEGVASFVDLSTRATYRLLENLKVYAEPKLELYSQRVQTRYEDDIYQSQLRLIDAYVQYNPISEVTLKAGTLSQQLLNQSLLVSPRRTFPGAQEIVDVPIRSVRISAMAQQSVPTSTSLNTERAEKEKLPGFLTEQLKLSNADEDQSFGWRAVGGHYRWQNIPSSTAFNSSLLGNQVYGDAMTNSRMRFAFDGWFTGAGFCVCALDVFKVDVDYERIHNSLAASNAADGQGISFQPTIVLRDVDFKLSYWTYFVESDATIANYVSSSTAGTNRIGQEYKFVADLKKLGFQIEARYGLADAINSNAVQKHFTEYYFGLESHYVAF